LSHSFSHDGNWNWILLYIYLSVHADLYIQLRVAQLFLIVRDALFSASPNLSEFLNRMSGIFACRTFVVGRLSLCRVQRTRLGSVCWTERGNFDQTTPTAFAASSTARYTHHPTPARPLCFSVRLTIWSC